MTKQKFDKIVKQLNKKLPAWYSVSTEFGGVSNNLVAVDDMYYPVSVFIYDRKVFGFADSYTIYIDKDCCGTAKRIALIQKQAHYYREIVEV